MTRIQMDQWRWADGVILFIIATVIYGVVLMANEWSADFHPMTQIDLSWTALPYYLLLSASRGFLAYLISLVFTLVVGYWAAQSVTAEKILIPLLDVFQSIPVLGFLPGLMLGLVALFPSTNTGLEWVAIIMIFTGQVWNMTFSFYASLKSIPQDLKEAATVMGLSSYQRLKKLELPFAAMDLVWNSILSMAGGWFFLIPCESFVLGNKNYRLPGIGAYMGAAIQQSDSLAMCLAIVGMMGMIFWIDFVVWRPALSWVQRFRLDSGHLSPAEPLMQVWVRESWVLKWMEIGARRLNKLLSGRLRWTRMKFRRSHVRVQAMLLVFTDQVNQWIQKVRQRIRWLWMSVLLLLVYEGSQLLKVLWEVPLDAWVKLSQQAFWTLLRVIGALMLSTIWAVPVGIWLGTSSQRIRRAQPWIQMMASFPAPMLYPLALSVCFYLGLNFGISSMLLMMLGVQWYILFNVLSGALRVPQALEEAMSLMKTKRLDRWKTLYLPSVFPSLTTGWMTAAGGAWNASVVAESVHYQGKILRTEGLGATLTATLESGNLTLLAATLTLMVGWVVLMNRFIWSKLYAISQRRYRMEI